jgi:hypothetical protein
LELPTNLISKTYNKIDNIQDKINKINGPEADAAKQIQPEFQ